MGKGKRIVWAACLLATLGSAPVLGQDAVVADTRGVIQALDFESGEIMVSGMRYVAANELRVSIADSWGAFTMLERGMKVHLVYQVIDGDRVVVGIRQLPAHVDVDA